MYLSYNFLLECLLSSENNITKNKYGVRFTTYYMRIFSRSCYENQNKDEINIHKMILCS